MVSSFKNHSLNICVFYTKRDVNTNGFERLFGGFKAYSPFICGKIRLNSA